MADTSELDAALLTRLAGDATLAALMQPGAFVFFSQAPPGSTRFVILDRTQSFDVPVFSGRSHEDALYQIDARMLSTAGSEGDMDAAALRIDQLLDGQPLSIVGYTLMTLQREEPIRMTEPDDLNPAILYRRRGGYYRLVAST